MLTEEDSGSEYLVYNQDIDQRSVLPNTDFREHIKLVADTSSRFELLQTMQIHTRMILHTVSKDLGFDPSNLSGEQQNLVLDAIFAEQGILEEVKDIYHLSQIYCGESFEQTALEVGQNYQEQKQKYVVASRDVLFQLNEPRSGVKPTDMLHLWDSYNQFADANSLRNFLNSIRCTDCDFESAENIGYILEQELQSMQLTSLLGDYQKETIAVFQERNIDDAKAERLLKAINMISLPVGVFISVIASRVSGGDISAPNLQINPEMAFGIVGGSTLLGFSTQYLSAFALNRFRDAHVETNRHFYEKFLHVNEKISLDDETQFLEAEQQRLYAYLQNLCSSLEVEDNIDLIASVQNFKDYLVRYMTSYDARSNPRLVDAALQSVMIMLATIAANYAGSHI